VIPCATCGAAPAGVFNDWSPRYPASCDHPPIWPGMPVHPDHARAIAAIGSRPTFGRLSADDVADAAKVAKKVGDKYAEERTASMKFKPKGYSIEDVNREGFAAELFVARWSGLPWNRGNRRKADVGVDVEVRSSRHPNAYMPIYSFDHFERRFVLVTGSAPNFRIVGWCVGSEVTTFENWRPKGAVLRGVTLTFACYAVPQDQLRPMETFDAIPEASATTA